jgi:hypothetical protein
MRSAQRQQCVAVIVAVVAVVLCGVGSVRGEDGLVVGGVRVFNTVNVANRFAASTLAHHVVTTHTLVDAAHPAGYGPVLVSGWLSLSFCFDVL